MAGVEGEFASLMPHQSKPMKLLFPGTGNSCRLQMAEGWARQLGEKWLDVQFADIESHGNTPALSRS